MISDKKLQGRFHLLAILLIPANSHLSISKLVDRTIGSSRIYSRSYFCFEEAVGISTPSARKFNSIFGATILSISDCGALPSSKKCF
jgi:hypothetical protein